MGRVIVQAGEKARVRMLNPGREHTNLADTLHGGALMAFIDCALFAGAHGCGLRGVSRAQTIDCSVQFIGAGRPGMPLDAVVELLRETGRMLFLRGQLEQDGALIAAFSATVRKPSPRS
jgi:acyl-coenzyme A thioesterase PaaI-like protein